MIYNLSRLMVKSILLKETYTVLVDVQQPMRDVQERERERWYYDYWYGTTILCM